MKRILLIASVLACGVVHAQSGYIPPQPDPTAGLAAMQGAADNIISRHVDPNQPTLSNGGMPEGYPAFIFVKRVPLGSGTPSVGVTTGYEKAQAVGNGLYQVPGYLPYNPSPEPVPPQVVQLRCVAAGALWTCEGYSINPELGRGENILIQPTFSR